VDPNGFNPRSHERGIDGSTTSETSLTSFLRLLAAKQLGPFLKTQPESRTLQKKLDKSHHHQKKFRILFFHKIQKMMKKKSSKYKNIESKKSFKKNLQNSITKKNLQKPYKNQKVSGKRRKPTTSLINHQGRKDY